jgi:uncharacterized protein (DUF488 family)
MVNEIYTIGYSGYTIDLFLAEIKKHAISAVIDVRSNPHSQYYSHYNKEPLEMLLKNNNIRYRNYAKEFGARQDNREFYSSKAFLLSRVALNKEKLFCHGGRIKTYADRVVDSTSILRVRPARFMKVSPDSPDHGCCNTKRVLDEILG